MTTSVSPRAARWVVALVAFASTAAVASADTVLWIDDNQGRLGTVNIDTGDVDVIGTMRLSPTGLPIVMTDIAFDSGGSLWGIDFNSLYRIDASTAQATFIGSLGGFGMNALVFDTDGTLYGASNSSGNLFTINTTTGTATAVGNSGFSSGGDLAFHGGELYLASASSQLVRLDTATGAGTAVGPFGFNNVYGLATGDDGVLYGISGTTIFSVNTATGAGTFVRDYGGQGLAGANGSAFVGEAQVVPLPGVAWMGLWLFGGLGVVGGIRRARSNRDGL